MCMKTGLVLHDSNPPSHNRTKDFFKKKKKIYCPWMSHNKSYINENRAHIFKEQDFCQVI